MKFTKMHGLGNDYLYVYGDVPENIAELSQKLSERHFGAGSDGMIYISKSDIADLRCGSSMQMEVKPKCLSALKHYPVLNI